MELNKVNSSSVGGLNNFESNGINKSDIVNKTDGLTKASVDVDLNTSNNITKRSELASNLSNLISHVSNSGSISSMIENQTKIIDNIQTKVSDLTNGSATAEQIQPDIASFISKYNGSVGSIQDKMAKLEDLKGESTTYFDGMAGAMPLDVDMLDNEMANKRTELKNTLESINKVDESLKKQAQNVISIESQSMQEKSPFKETNFGKESADFSGANMTSISGSIASSQANAVQTQVIKLLS